MEASTEPMMWVVEPIGDRPDHECIMGDGMANTFVSVGCLGAVTSGRVRDIEAIAAVPFAVYARGRCVHHAALRYVEIDVPVEVGGLIVNSGDIIHASKEGVIKIPSDSAEPLLQWAPKVRAFEHDAHTLLRRTDISITDKRGRLAELRRSCGLDKPHTSAVK
jgi:regulator of RNase E activity RraA